VEKLYSLKKYYRLNLYNQCRNVIKQLVVHAPIALTKNERIDRQTKRVIKKVLHPNGIGVDIGAHKGKITEMMLAASPHQQHFGFEPIPILFQQLKNKYQQKIQLYPYALSNTIGNSTFNLVTTNMAFSGIKKRPYDRIEKDKNITVTVNTLDNIIPPSTFIHLIKIDVEGAEYWVLKGALQTITRCKPIILFEFGKTGAEVYGITADKMFALWHETLNYNIYTLKNWLQNKPSLNYAAFNNYFIHENLYFFLAAPQQQ